MIRKHSFDMSQHIPECAASLGPVCERGKKNQRDSFTCVLIFQMFANIMTVGGGETEGGVNSSKTWLSTCLQKKAAS